MPAMALFSESLKKSFSLLILLLKQFAHIFRCCALFVFPLFLNCWGRNRLRIPDEAPSRVALGTRRVSFYFFFKLKKDLKENCRLTYSDRGRKHWELETKKYKNPII